MLKSMKDNRAVKMLKAAEEGGYGVIGVVSVSYDPSRAILWQLLIESSITSKP
jgi:fructose-bisphosphate aldolase class II